MSDLPGLAADDFGAFFEAIHGLPPFPWQARLAAHVAGDGHWPEVLDLPTGAGKTAAIDVAVFQLALEAGRPNRVAALRMVYVVDRRTIVDQAHERARRIARAIERAEDGVLAAVRARLASYARDRVPLQVALLRGGIARSDLWARSPEQPLIVVSTVDQVGSRLLFRGYGVSDAMKPIHAGLLGMDALYLLDEVHLSEPFRETLSAIRQRYADWAERIPGKPIAMVEMSATPGRSCAERFSLDASDRAHPVLSRRLTATKPTTLFEVSARAFAAELEKQTAELAQPGATVAVVVNRVAAARDLHRRLRDRLTEAEVYLVTGRMRPLDRDALEKDLFERIRAGRRRDPQQRPVVVVATQCIEAGADFDFDALVTECASLDALRQRFGRLDRLGETHGRARGVVIAQTQLLEDDPVYGAALGTTWRWLEQLRGGVDFGLGVLAVPEDVAELGLLAPRSHAPILLPSHLDAWVQTSPTPTPDPDVALWLHGPQRGVADVQVVWRADLNADLLRQASDHEAPGWSDSRDVALGAVEAIAPASGEAMSVPFAAVKRWLEGRVEPEIADVEGCLDIGDDADKDADGDGPRPALVWRGDASDVIAPTDLRPGDTIVVPAIYGGIASGTWSPQSREPVVDLAEVAGLRQRGRAQLRLHPDVIAGLFSEAVSPPPVPEPLDREQVDDVAVVREWLKVLPVKDLTGDVAGLVRFLITESDRRTLRVERVRLGVDTDASEYFLVGSRRRVSYDGIEVTTEDDQSSFTGVAVPLAEHLHGVGETAVEFARRLGMPEDLGADVDLAGRWHDVGKIDPRFQRLLHGGSEFKALVAKQPLAKSSAVMNDRRARELALQRSAYPRGARHELMSLALMAGAHAELAPRANDWDLVQHLVASHHGRCRPLAPWVPDPAPAEMQWEFDGIRVAGSSAHDLARLDSGVAERFWRLVRRYGWWGLPWLEAVLRLGDHRRSEEEQRSRAGGEA